MSPTERRALLAIALLAAFADASKTGPERDEVRRVAEALAADAGGTDLAALYHDVLLGRGSLAQAAADLAHGSIELRQLGYEFAVGVCDADGLRNEAETRFLGELGHALGLTQPQMVEPAINADALATLPLDETAAAPRSDQGTGATAVGPAARDEAELDAMVLNCAILSGALELLPQSLASMAIIPLQMKMVHRIGRFHGHDLERGQIRDLFAAVGIGMTGQYLETIARRLAGGLLGSVADGMAGGLARAATGVAFSFATTYALGQVALRYYAGGRTMTAPMLNEAYRALLEQARSLQARYAQQIEQQARTVDVGRIVHRLRGL